MNIQNKFAPWFASGLFVLDRVSKLLVRKILLTSQTEISVLPGILSLHALENTGAAFSLFSARPALLTVFSVLITILLLICLIAGRSRIEKLECLCLWSVCAGSAGNALDRVLYGAVTDFLQTDFINFPVFNLADCWITLGCLVLISTILLRKEKKNV